MKKIVSIIFIILLISSCVKTDYETVIEEVVIFKNPTLTEENLMSEIERLKFEHPELILAQAKLESANLTSPIATFNHNLFGMKMPRVRKTTAKESPYNVYAFYDNWIKCVEDRKIYDSLYFSGLTQEQYLDKLQRIYAEDPKYKQKLINMIN